MDPASRVWFHACEEDSMKPHVRSRHPNALPLIITHGWPGSVFEQIKRIGPLTDPTKYGGAAFGSLRAAQ
jgi:hypothetical protein